MPDTQITLRLYPGLAERIGVLVERLAENEDFATLAPVTRTSIARAALLSGLREFERDYAEKLADSTPYTPPEKAARPPQNVAGRVIMPIAIPNFLLARVEHLIPILEADPRVRSTGRIPRSAVLHSIILWGVVALEKAYVPEKKHGLFSELGPVLGDWSVDPDAPGRSPNGSKASARNKKKEGKQ